MLPCIAAPCHYSQIWPKVIELTAPLLFYGMIPAAYLHTYATYQSAFIMINFWFVAVELVFLAAGRNFIEEYLNDWNPKEVRGVGAVVQLLVMCCCHRLHHNRLQAGTVAAV